MSIGMQDYNKSRQSIDMQATCIDTGHSWPLYGGALLPPFSIIPFKIGRISSSFF